MKALVLPAALLLLATLDPQLSIGLAQGTVFTYQGRLDDGGKPASGNYEILFRPFNVSTGGSQLTIPILRPVVASNGLFTTTLDFGSSMFAGGPVFLQLEVRTNGAASFSVLAPRQQSTPTPYAIYAGGAGASGITGTIPASALGNAWLLSGNSNTVSGQFIGTTDNQALEFKVNGQRGLRLEPTASPDTVNVIGGSAFNFVGAGVVGATIGGGGSGNAFDGVHTNRVDASYGTVSGGLENTIQSGASYATLGGGYLNSIQPGSAYSTLGGGYLNSIQTNSLYATLGGGEGNTIRKNAFCATIGGGAANTIRNDASYATIPGGFSNSATNYAFAAGNRAQAVTAGTFVWADSQSADFASTAANQFLIRASGGVGIGKTDPATALDVNGTVTANGFAGNGSGLTGLSAGNLATGTIPSGVLSGTYGSAVTFNNAANNFTGNGAGLANLTASGIASGTVADARLSANVALLSGTQNFSGAKTFSSEVAANSGVRINNTNLWFKGDNQHGLGWYGSGRPFAGSSTIDGPVLFGFSGGALATEQFGTEHLAVQWSATSVTVNGTFNNNSDRNAKERFTVVSPAEVLAKVCQLPVAEWSYKTDAAIRHLGPMAQDFFSVFNLGTDDKHIAPIDEGGVALAAIQGLNDKVEVRSLKSEDRIQRLETENAELKQRLEALERIIRNQKPN